MSTFQPHCYQYYIYRWTALNHLKHKDEQAMLTLSATACEFIIHLQKSLVLGKEGLHRQLFTRFWQQISQELDRLIFTMVYYYLYMLALTLYTSIKAGVSNLLARRA